MIIKTLTPIPPGYGGERDMTEHVHKFNAMQKCKHPGCGAFCQCGAFREYTTGKVFASQDEAVQYVSELKTHVLEYLKFWEDYRKRMSEWALKIQSEADGLPTYDDTDHERIYSEFVEFKRNEK